MCLRETKKKNAHVKMKVVKKLDVGNLQKEFISYVGRTKK